MAVPSSTLSQPPSPSASLPSPCFPSPRSSSYTRSPSFKAFEDPFRGLAASPRPSLPRRSPSFKGLEDPFLGSCDRFDMAAFRASFKKKTSQGIPSVTAYASCATQQKGFFDVSTEAGEVKKTCYSILNVAPTASPKEIRLAYRKLALQCHPDVAPLHDLESATKLFSQINEAYSILSDPQKRDSYDLQLAIKVPTSVQAGYGTTRKYTNMATGRVYPSMNSFYREWKGARNWETGQC